MKALQIFLAVFFANFPCDENSAKCSKCWFLLVFQRDVERLANGGTQLKAKPYSRDEPFFGFSETIGGRATAPPRTGCLQNIYL